MNPKRVRMAEPASALPSTSPLLATDPTVTTIVPLEMKKKLYVVAIDIETTGTLGQGEIFAIGIALAKYPDNDWNREADHDGSIVPLEQIRLVMQILSSAERATYGPDVSAYEIWSSVWDKRGWERRCFDEFWGKPENLKMLDELNEQASYFDLKSFAQGFNRTLANLEDRYRWSDPSKMSDVTYVSDTMNFDFPWLNWLLSTIQQPSMIYYRNGKYGPTSWYLGCYIRGLLNISPLDMDWKLDEKPISDALKAIADKFAPHDHDPAKDALNILIRFLFARQVVQDQKSEWEMNDPPYGDNELEELKRKNAVAAPIEFIQSAASQD